MMIPWHSESIDSTRHKSSSCIETILTDLDLSSRNVLIGAAHHEDCALFAKR
jgi:hypothetical protein